MEASSVDAPVTGSPIRSAVGLLAWVVGGLLALGGLLNLFGLPFSAWLAYAAHLALFVAGPGVLVYLALAERPVPPLTLLTQGFCLGLSLETLAYLTLLMGKKPSLIFWYPVPFVVLLLVRGRTLLTRVDTRTSSSPALKLALLASMLLVVFTTGSEVFNPQTNHHACWPIAFARAGLDQWPLMDPFALGQSVHYHYLYYLHFSIAHLVTGQSLTLLVTRSAVPMALAILVVLLYDVARGQVRRAWLALLVPVQALLTVGYHAPILFSWLGHVIGASSYHVPATLASLLIFFSLLREIDFFLTAPRPRLSHLSIIAVMALAASGFRATVLPVMGVSVALLALLRARHGLGFRRHVLLVVLMVICFACGVFVFLGLGGDNDATGELQLRPLTHRDARHLDPYLWLVEQGVPQRLAAGLTVVPSHVARLTFLLPGLVVFLISWRRREITLGPLRLLIAGAGVSGFVVAVLIYSPYGTATFAHFGVVGAGILAVVGLDHLLDGASARRVRLVAIASAAFLALHAFDVVTTVHSEFDRLGLRARRRVPSLFEPGSDLDLVARAMREHTLQDTLFVVSGRSAGCRRNAELRLAADQTRFRLFGASLIVGRYASRRGAGDDLRRQADLLDRLGRPSQQRWNAAHDLRGLLPEGSELMVVDCGGAGALRNLPPGAEVLLRTRKMSLVLLRDP